MSPLIYFFPCISKTFEYLGLATIAVFSCATVLLQKWCGIKRARPYATARDKQQKSFYLLTNYFTMSQEQNYSVNFVKVRLSTELSSLFKAR